MTTRGGFFKDMRGLTGIDLDQRDVEIRSQGRQDQAGKATAAAQVGKASGLGRDKGGKLGRIEDMPGPDVLDCGPADQIDRLLPFDQGLDQGLELIECFT